MPQNKCAPLHLDRTLVRDLGDNNMVGSEKDLFGVEIELEGRRILTKAEAIMKWWTIHQDGSLRANKPGSEAYEYVFKRPLNMADTQVAVKALFDYLNKNPGTEVFDSYRTSIHVHVNCLQESLRVIFNFITLAVIFDELFVSQNGETRIGNNFCLRSRDAEGQIVNLIDSVIGNGSFFGLQHNYRYSSINLSSLLKFGTIEFRSLECTTDIRRVLDWIGVLQGLKEAARGYENPREIIAKFSRRGPLGFMMTHLGDYAGKYATLPGSQKLLRDGMWLAQDFAYCSEWKLADAKQKLEPKRRSKYVGVDDQMEHAQMILNHMAGGAPNPWALGGPGQVQPILHDPAMWGPPQHQQAIPMPAPAIVEDDDDEDEDMPMPDFDDDDDEE